MTLFLLIFFLAILFTKSLALISVYLLLFIVVPKSLFLLIICFIELNLSSDTFTQSGINQSDSFFDFCSVTLSVIFLGASKNLSFYVIMFLLLNWLIISFLFSTNSLKLVKILLCAGKKNYFLLFFFLLLPLNIFNFFRNSNF